jgi:starch synthase
MHILFATLEVAPFSKTGGLGDVAKGLPEALERRGVRVTVLTPWYRTIPERDPRFREMVTIRPGVLLLGDITIPIVWRKAADPPPGPELIFLDEPVYISRDGPYAPGAARSRFTQEPEGSILFSKAVRDWVTYHPDPERVVHLNDHQTALAAPLLKAHPGSPPVVLTVHNFAFHGSYGPEILPLLGLPMDGYFPGGPLEFYGQVNFLKAGLVWSDAITTVSRTYRNEAVMDRQTSLGLEGVLRERQERFVGIINGVDSSLWSPATSPHISPHFHAGKISGKRKVKRKLLLELGLSPHLLETPLFAVIARLVEQKGIELVLAVAERLLQQSAALVVLGEGRGDYEQALRSLQARYPERCRAPLAYEEGLAHRLEGGADIFLMPSLFEPCGLNQLYSLAFGTVPIVRLTGGLADTVIDLRASEEKGTGYTFFDPTPEAFWSAIQAALHDYREPKRWLRMMKRGMKEDHSWDAAARKYIQLYRSLLDGKGVPPL